MFGQKRRGCLTNYRHSFKVVSMPLFTEWQIYNMKYSGWKAEAWWAFCERFMCSSLRSWLLGLRAIS